MSARRGLWWPLVLGLLALLALLCSAGVPAADDAAASDAHAAPRLVLELRVDGPISPASADYLVRGIAEANDRKANAVLLTLDTPGGLISSMRDIIKAMLNSSVPVIGHVAPQGSRAASAGTYIMYASHVAAMAPATNIGAATPVSITGSGNPLRPRKDDEEVEQAPADSPEIRKAINDSVAYIRALAEQRGRNADWAEEAVRDAVSISAEQALELGVIDLIEPTALSLLAAVDGREVTTPMGTVTLQTAGAAVELLEPGWRSQFLGVIANPSVALILLMMGLGGLAMEGSHPGGILPGVVGAICLLLALYAFQLLPVNFAGLGLMLLGMVLIVAEAFVPAFGILAVGGAVALVVGAVILMRSGSLAYGIALPTIVGIALAGAGVIVGVIWMAIRSHRHPIVSGSEEMIGAIGVVVSDFVDRGLVHVHGERWQAESGRPLQQGQRVTVISRDGLVLQVQPAGTGKEQAG